MKRNLLTYILILLFFVFSYGNVNASETYDVKVELWNAYEETLSMGNGGLESKAKLILDGDDARLRLKMKALDIMGSKGFLGELVVEGKVAKVLSTFDDIDTYNDPNTGIDEKMKGKKYPKTLEFPVNLDKDIMDCSVYVPVMGEMGVGVQKARIKIYYPNNVGEAEEKSQEKTEPTTELVTTETNVDENAQGDVKEEAYFRVPVSLLHSVEDKLSMGNGSIEGVADMHFKNGKYTIYLASSKMEFSGITASMINMYYDNGKEYKKAKAYAYDMKVKGYDELRPEIFSFPLNNEKEIINVMIDPKVEAMGDDPIKARLKVDFLNKEEIKRDDAKLILRAESGSAEKAFNAKAERTVKDKGFVLEVPAGSFEKNYTFYANEIRGERADFFRDIVLKKGGLDIVRVYSLEVLGDLNTITYDMKRPINSSREHFQPKKELKISIPINEKIALSRKSLELMAMILDGDTYKPEKIEYEIDGGYLRFTYDKLGEFLIHYTNDSSAELTKNNSEPSDKKEIKVSNESASSKTSVIVTGDKIVEKESPELIFFFIFIMAVLLVLGIYFSIKYYRILIKELAYGEQIKIELIKKYEKGGRK